MYDAGAVSFKTLLRNYCKWDIDETYKAGIDVKLSTEATKELVEEVKPDAIIIATGSTYIKPNIRSIHNDNVFMLNDVENKRVTIGDHVVTCGAGLSGIEGAVSLAREGKSVTVVDVLPEESFCANMFGITRSALFDEVHAAKVNLVGNSKIVEFTTAGVVIEKKDGSTLTMAADAIIISFGLKSETDSISRLFSSCPQTLT